MDNNKAANVGKSLLDLPGEIRNNIYSMVTDDTCTSPGWITSPNIDGMLINLCRQPRLARVNRQLRNEFLSMWYGENSVGIRIYAEKHEEADQVWRESLDRLDALRIPTLWHLEPDGKTAGSRSCLSHVRNLEVQIWHPAHDSSRSHRYEVTYNMYNSVFSKANPGGYTRRVCNGLALLFGPNTTIRVPTARVGSDDTDWTDRGAVRGALVEAVVQEQRIRGFGFHAPGHPVSPPEHGRRAEAFLSREFPFDRLVDLAMTIVAECDEAARLVYIHTSFAPVPTRRLPLVSVAIYV